MRNYPKILLLSNNQVETNALEGILSEYVALKSVGNLLELQSVLQGGGYDAIFCGWSFHQGTWNDALQKVRQRCPDLPVIVFCRAGGEKEWVEALEAGAFDLLIAPYMKGNVLPLLEHAVASHEARRLHNATACSRTKAS
ncbi:MAG: response regulator [Acidobacteria bacterium]|nr:response regulator [Acidobacteriota bacterium]